MSKSKDIELWMPLYIADYLADTTRLTTEQHGAYMLLIMDYWRNGSLPDDDNILANITKLTPQAWRKHRTSIAKLFQIADGEWKHKRIDKEIANANENSKTAKARAKKGANARWKDHNKEKSSNNQEQLEQSLNNASSNASSIHQAQLEQCSVIAPSPSPSPSPYIKNTLSQDARPEFEPDLNLVNTKLKLSGMDETTQTELNQILVKFNLKTGHLHQTDNEKLGSLLTWFKNERQTELANKSRLSKQNDSVERGHFGIPVAEINANARAGESAYDCAARLNKSQGNSEPEPTKPRAEIGNAFAGIDRQKFLELKKHDPDVTELEVREVSKATGKDIFTIMSGMIQAFPIKTSVQA